MYRIRRTIVYHDDNGKSIIRKKCCRKLDWYFGFDCEMYLYVQVGLRSLSLILLIIFVSCGEPCGKMDKIVFCNEEVAELCFWRNFLQDCVGCSLRNIFRNGHLSWPFCHLWKTEVIIFLTLKWPRVEHNSLMSSSFSPQRALESK